MKEKNCKIFKTHLSNIKNDVVHIGDFFLAKDNQLAVKCGNGILIIDELQIEGKKRMLTQEFLRGCQIF